MYKNKIKSWWDGGYFELSEKKTSASLEKVQTKQGLYDVADTEDTEDSSIKRQ